MFAVSWLPPAIIRHSNTLVEFFYLVIKWHKCSWSESQLLLQAWKLRRTKCSKKYLFLSKIKIEGFCKFWVKNQFWQRPESIMWTTTHLDPFRNKKCNFWNQFLRLLWPGLKLLIKCEIKTIWKSERQVRSSYAWL